MCPVVSMICQVAARTSLACACLWALGAIIAVVCSADLCGSFPWTDRCFGQHICSLLAELSFVDHRFGCLFFRFSAQSFLPLIGMVHGRYLVRLICPLTFLECDVAGWWLLAGLVLTHRVAMEPPCCAWYFCGSPTNLRWHYFPSSSIGDEFNLCYNLQSISLSVLWLYIS